MQALKKIPWLKHYLRAWPTACPKITTFWQTLVRMFRRKDSASVPVRRANQRPAVFTAYAKHFALIKKKFQHRLTLGCCRRRAQAIAWSYAVHLSDIYFSDAFSISCSTVGNISTISIIQQSNINNQCSYVLPLTCMMSVKQQIKLPIKEFIMICVIRLFWRVENVIIAFDRAVGYRDIIIKRLEG